MPRQSAGSGGRTGPARPMLVAGVVLAVLAVLGSVAPGDRGQAGADASRFVPWTRPETPALALKDLDGRDRTLHEHRGKVLLVNFWATWCEPCRDEMPSLARLRARLGDQGFGVLAVNYGESPARVRDFVTKERLDVPVVLDPGQTVARAWRVRTLPSSFLVGAEGSVRYAVVGELDWMREDAVTTVRSLLPPGRAALGGGPTGMLAGRGGR